MAVMPADNRNVLYGGTPALNLLSTNVMSQGDDPGVALGVVSHLVMGPTRPVTGAFTVLTSRIPSTRLTSVNLHNLFNAPGMATSPRGFQLSVLLLAP